jgi:cystathionine beta-lyase
MKYDFDTLPNRRASESAKWQYYEADVLPMWVADMDFVSPQPVIEALQARVAHGVFGYPMGLTGLPNELREFREMLIERFDRLYGWKVQPEDLLLIPGVVTALNLATHAFVPAGGSVLVQPPVYPPFLHLGENARVGLQHAPLSRDSRSGVYSFDATSFDAAFTPETRLFALCNPHNPVGRAFQRSELEQMAEICLRRDVLICSDEIHCDLIFSGYQHIPIASLSPEVARRTITLFQDRELRKQLMQARQGLVGWVNLMGLVAAEAAYRDGQEWLDQLLVYLEANRDYLYEYVQRELPGIQMALPEATYLAWLDCRSLGLDRDPYDFFLEKARVALNQGSSFGPGGEGFVRLNFGCPRSMLADALERMKRALAEKA